MKYTKIALIGFMCASLLSSCEKEKTNFGPGDATVYFTMQDDGSEPATESIALEIAENASYQNIPIRFTGTPGGFPIEVKVKAEGLTNVENVDDVMLITSNTIKITEDNNSFLQFYPVNRPSDIEDCSVKLTIEEATGANIGRTTECIVTIKNIYSVKYGTYSFEPVRGNPASWTFYLREGPSGTYILENMFDIESAPKLLGSFDEKTKEIIFDGRLYGRGSESYFANPNLGREGEYYLIMFSGQTGLEFLKLKVNDEWEVVSTNLASFSYGLYSLDATGATPYGDPYGFWQGGGTIQYAGELPPDEWPFD